MNVYNMKDIEDTRKGLLQIQSVFFRLKLQFPTIVFSKTKLVYRDNESLRVIVNTAVVLISHNSINSKRTFQVKLVTICLKIRAALYRETDVHCSI